MLGRGHRITLGLRVITIDVFYVPRKVAVFVTAAIRSCFGMYFCGLNCIFECRDQGVPVWVVRGKSLCYNQGVLGTLHSRIGNINGLVCIGLGVQNCLAFAAAFAESPATPAPSAII